MSYDVIAPFYDTVMDHVDYTEWYDLILSIIKKYRIKPPVALLEIGGGTGTLGKMIAGNTKLFQYVGSDLCFNMAAQARKKTLPVFCADGRFLPLKRKFDMVIFLYDGINYLPSLKDYRRLFLSVAECLKPEGLFLFDITTRENSFSNFYDLYDYQEIRGTSVIRHSYYLPEKSIQRNDFIFFSPVENGRHQFTKTCESHVQKVFTPEEIVKGIPESLFSCREILNEFTMKPYTSNSDRIHFLLQKKTDD